MQPAIADADHQPVIEEVELDVEGLVAIGDRRSRQPARRQVKRHFPPMIDVRREFQPHLADDLQPHVQRRAGRLPIGNRQFRQQNTHINPKLNPIVTLNPTVKSPRRHQCFY